MSSFTVLSTLIEEWNQYPSNTLVFIDYPGRGEFIIEKPGFTEMGYQVGEDNFVFDKEFLEENDAPKELGPCLYFYNEGHYRNDVEPMLLGNLLSYLKQFPEDSKVFVTNKYQNIVHFQGSSYHEDGIWDENFTNISWTEFEKDMDDTFEVHGQGPILVVQSD